MRKLNDKELKYARQVNLKFAEEEYPEWWEFHKAIEQIISEQELKTEIAYFQSMADDKKLIRSTGISSYERLENMQNYAIISSVSLRPDVFSDRVASAIGSVKSNIAFYINGLMIEKDGKSPVKNILEKSLQDIDLFLVTDELPVQLNLIDNSLVYLDPCFEVSKWVCSTKIEPNERVTEYVKEHLNKLNSVPIDNSNFDIIVEKTLDECIDEYRNPAYFSN